MLTINLKEKTVEEILTKLKEYRNHKEITNVKAEVLLRKLHSIYQECKEIEEMRNDYLGLLNSDNQLDDFSCLLRVDEQNDLGKIHGESFWHEILEDKPILDKIKDTIRFVDSRIKTSLSEYETRRDTIIRHIKNYGVLVIVDRVKIPVPIENVFEENLVPLNKA